MGDFREPDGAPSPSTPSPSSNPDPNPSSISPARWVRAEKATQKIIWKVQPTVVSEERRRGVVDYVQRLFRNYLGCEVFPYGSVPLKTYLPDGDIDLTAFGGPSAEDTLANGMVSILEGEDQSRAAEFAVKDIQLIRAEVKLVKCIVQNIVVDISFNQIGGLCTLCFLEQVDYLIGREHLFKRSIILIKAWCYYESRILGAHHGLISTYALETLVLYIFHLFHSTLNGPLQVLYKFLDYFSKFDWENYCVSLNGPVRLSSLPNLVEIPDNGGSDLLLSSEFLRYCTDMFSVPSRGADSNSRTFQPKHLNIVDPLKENNNLGRSVSKGNFYRIRSAFTYGARKLGRVLLQSEDNIADGLRRFFFNTLDRHGNGQRPDVQVARPICTYRAYSPVLSTQEANSCAVEKLYLESKSDTNGSLHDGSSDLNASGLHSKNEVEVLLSKSSFESDRHETENALDHRAFGDAQDLASYRFEGPKKPVEQLYFSNSMLSNGEKTNGNSDMIWSRKFPKDNHTGISCDSNGIIDGCGLNENLTAVEEDVAPGGPLSDLSGNYENQLNSLQHGRWFYEHASNVQALTRHPPPHPVFHVKNLRDSFHHSSQFKQNGFPPKVDNGIIPNQGYYPVNSVMVPTMSFSLEDMPKPRGTGTYFPNMNRLPPPVHRPSAAKGRNHAVLRSTRNVSQNSMFMETNMVDQTSPDLLYSPASGDQSDGGNHVHSNVHHSLTSQENRYPNNNGVTLQTERGFEFGSVESVPVETNQPDTSRHHHQRCLSSQDDTRPVSPTRATRMVKPVLSRDRDRVSVESSYHLKDEDDFPPLSV